MSRRIVAAWVLVVVASLPARAQAPFARDLIPKREALARLGLERQFLAITPMRNDERVLGISMADGLFFAQTNHGYLHTLDAETGRLLWSTRLGARAARSRPTSANSFAVFVTNLNKLFMLDRKTGSIIWEKPLEDLPSSPTTCDEERVMVSLANGKIYAFKLKTKAEDDPKVMVVSGVPLDLWNWQTDDVIETRALPASKLVVFGSNDGKVYVALSDERTMVYRIATGGPIGAGLGALGTRLLLIPSADRNLYGTDLFTAKVLWSFATGAPIKQEPLVAGNEVFVVNSAGLLSSVDPNNGTAVWTTQTQGGRLVAISPKRIYMESHDGDLFIMDRATGQTIADPRATFERVGLNLRSYEYYLTNRENDRLYFASSSGMLIGLREIGRLKPIPLRDPKALPFGYIPREGIPLTPPNPNPPPEPGAEAPPAADADNAK